MPKDIEKVYSRFTVTQINMVLIPEDELKRYIDSNLANHLAKLIVKNIDDLPIKQIEEVCQENGNHEFTMKINIISDEELQRLRKIEDEYNIFKFTGWRKYE